MASAPTLLLVDLPMGLFMVWLALTLALIVIGAVWLARPGDAGTPLKRVGVVWLAATVVLIVVSARVFGHPRVTLVQSPPAPNFSVQTLDGQTYSLQSLHGKVALIEFWASWCGPCRESLPEMMRVYRDFGPRKQFVMIGVSEDEDQNKFEDFVARNGIRWHQHWDPQGALMNRFGTDALPSIAVIDADGRMRFFQKGYGGDTFLRLREILRTALDGGPRIAAANP